LLHSGLFSKKGLFRSELILLVGFGTDSSGQVEEKSDMPCYITDVIPRKTLCTALSFESGRKRESCLSDTPLAGILRIRVGLDTSSEFKPIPVSTLLQLEADDCRDRIISERAEFIDAFLKQGSKVYICGSPQLSEGVKQAIVSIWSEYEGKTEEEGWEWMRGEGKERIATDVFL